ncbi:hypothetical protein, partial [Corallococcus llansteffanensis]
MTPSGEELLAIARLYWGADEIYRFRQEPSPEDLRFKALWKEKRKEFGRWVHLIHEIRAALPNFDVWDYTPPGANPSFGVLVYPPQEEILHRPQLTWTVCGYLSILAPVYNVHCVRREFLGKHLRISKVFLGLAPLELRGIAKLIAERIEANYGATAL